MEKIQVQLSEEEKRFLQHTLMVSKEEYSYVAALIERLADYYGVDKPLWIYNKDKYYLDNPYFPIECKGRPRWFLLIDSPVPFKKRNIFVSNDHFIRV